jgi:hypothetical protein
MIPARLLIHSNAIIHSNARGCTMAQPPIPGSQAPDQNPTGREILRMGLGNYFSNRWAPKNPAGQFVFGIGIFFVFLLILTIMVKLAQG